jgi:dihydromonapterin reductase / dihydrofolate reductase
MMSDPVLITGVGKRLGLALAADLRERGVPVIGTYRSTRPSIPKLRELGVDLYRCDLTDDDELERFIEYVRTRYMALRAIVHNASDWSSDDTDDPKSTVRSMMDVHVTAPYTLNLTLEPLLRACSEEHADIIHIGDYVSSRGSKRHVAYSASKAAQDNLTLSFAARYAPSIKVNSVAPALLMFNPGDDEEYRVKASGKNLMGRAGGTEPFLQTINYLMSNSFVTGRVLALDGGRHVA